MLARFNVVFTEEAAEFLNTLGDAVSEKILYNIRKSQILRDPDLFKKLDDNIWEFRTLYHNTHFRLLHFGIHRRPRRQLWW